MKELIKLKFDFALCRRELREFKSLLDSVPTLEERAVILPFFKERHHLSAFVGSYFANLDRFDRLAFEYSLFGDFVCDLVVGDSEKGCYGFVEFEEAGPTSIFRSSGRSTPEWSPRFEHGFSQIVDWFYMLDDMKSTGRFQDMFGRRDIYYDGMLIIGRSNALYTTQLHRLRWRQNKVAVDSKRIHCVTFDELYQDLLSRFRFYKRVYLAEQQS
jgi:hypothetical protein